MKESRMDRIERVMEEFFRGMAELRESQKKTDGQILRTHEEIRELRESQIKTDEQIRELRESQIKTDEQQRKTDEQLRKTDDQLRETSKKLENTSTTLGNLGVIDGKVAEDLFYRNVRHIFGQKNLAFSSVSRNVKKNGVGEYDIVAVGENRVLVVEVKKKMEQDMVDEFLKKKIPRFRKIYPQYRDFPLIGGVGALVMQDEISRYAEKKGLYVLTQNGEGGAMLANGDNFRAKEF